MLRVQNIQRTFVDQTVLHGVNLEVQTGEIVCLLGASGCGKTTLLRIIAGLEQSDTGDIMLDGQSIMDTPVHQRDFGLMFQDFALFPHMNIERNIAFGLKMHGLSQTKQTQRVSEVLQLVGLAGFEKRDVTQLSGGERQRVALARSLAPGPRLLMLDEPLGSLDASLKEYLVVELREIVKRIGLTTVYVTHDQLEAFAIADRIAIMNAGIIEQVDTPEAIYQRPKTAFVAQFLGLNNIIPVLKHRDGSVDTVLGTFQVESKPNALLLHPDGIRLVDVDTPGAFPGTISERVFLGDAYRLRITLEHDLIFTVIVPTYTNGGYPVDKTVGVQAEIIIPLC